MKKLINKIGRLIVFIIITLMCYFSICKDLILLDKNKISMLEFDQKICDTIDKYIFKAYYCDLIDADKAFNISDKIIKIEVNILKV